MISNAWWTRSFNSRPILLSLIIAAGLFTIVRFNLAVTLGQDAGYELQAAYRLTAGLGNTSYLEAPPNPDLSKASVPIPVHHWPPGYSYILAALMKLGATDGLAIKIVCALCTMVGWCGWALVLERLWQRRADTGPGDFPLFYFLLFLLPLVDTPSWRGTDIIVWTVVPWSVVAFVSACGYRGFITVGALCGLMYFFRFAGFFIFASYCLILTAFCLGGEWKKSLSREFFVAAIFLAIAVPINSMMAPTHAALGPPAASLGLHNALPRILLACANFQYLTLPAFYWLPNSIREQMLASLPFKLFLYPLGLFFLLIFPLLFFLFKFRPADTARRTILVLAGLVSGYQLFLILATIQLGDKIYLTQERLYTPIHLPLLFIGIAWLTSRHWECDKKVQEKIVCVALGVVALAIGIFAFMPSGQGGVFGKIAKIRGSIIRDNLHESGFKTRKPLSQAFVLELAKTNPDAVFFIQDYPFYVFNQVDPDGRFRIIPGMDYWNKAFSSKNLILYWVVLQHPGEGSILKVTDSGIELPDLDRRFDLEKVAEFPSEETVIYRSIVSASASPNGTQ